MPQQQIDPRLAKLAALQALNPAPQDNTPQMLQMLTQLYGIQQEQQLAPEKLAALHADTLYRNAAANELGHGKDAEEKYRKLSVLAQLHLGDPANPDYRTAINNELGIQQPPPKVLPTGPIKPPKPSHLKETIARELNSPNPGYNPNLNLGHALYNLPLQTANAGRLMFNHLLLPANNLIDSLTGLPPAQAIPPITRYPTKQEMKPQLPSWLTDTFNRK